VAGRAGRSHGSPRAGRMPGCPSGNSGASLRDGTVAG
jgi:hypothetical protein